MHVSAAGLGSDTSIGSNHFALRDYPSGVAAKDRLSVSGRGSMSMYSNRPGATTQFYLARVLQNQAGQSLEVELFDVGDDLQGRTGTIQIKPPPASGVTQFTSYAASGPVTGTLSTCSFNVNLDTHNGRTQTVYVPIPSTYQCNDSDPTDCWVRLNYVYGGGSAPVDITTWEASIRGDPVRLVE